MAPHGNRRAPCTRRGPPAPPSCGSATPAPGWSGPARYDVIITDVFAGAAMPAGVASAGLARAARRALRPDGLPAMNLTDVPPLAHTRIQAATARTASDDVVLFGAVPVMRGRRAGNVILLAGNVPMIKPAKHECVLSGSDLPNLTGGATPLLDEPGRARSGRLMDIGTPPFAMPPRRRSLP